MNFDDRVNQEIYALMTAFASRSVMPSEVFHIPSMFSLKGRFHWFNSPRDVENFFTGVEQVKQSTGWAYSTVGCLDVCQLRDESVIVTVSWNRYQSDGTLLEVACVTYTLLKLDAGWRILLASLHDSSHGLGKVTRYQPLLSVLSKDSDP